MALGGTSRGKRTTLRLPVAAGLARFNDWMADLRVRRAHPPWFEPAMPATWQERFTEIAKEPRRVLWSIESDGRLVGLAVGRVWDSGVGPEGRQLLIDRSEWRRGDGAAA